MQGIYYLADATSFVDTYGDDRIARLLGDGLQTALIGIVAVFAVLSILWGSLEIFKYVFYTLPERKKNKKAEKTAVEAPVQVVSPAPEAQVQAVSNDQEIVAAIIAAITAARSEEGCENAPAFRVVSFRKRK